MSPQVVIVTDRITRLYWLTIGVSVVLFGTLIGLATVYAFLRSGWPF
jgi:hypothetical protein